MKRRCITPYQHLYHLDSKLNKGKLQKPWKYFIFYTGNTTHNLDAHTETLKGRVSRLRNLTSSSLSILSASFPWPTSSLAIIQDKITSYRLLKQQVHAHLVHNDSWWCQIPGNLFYFWNEIKLHSIAYIVCFQPKTF